MLKWGGGGEIYNLHKVVLFIFLVFCLHSVTFAADYRVEVGESRYIDTYQLYDASTSGAVPTGAITPTYVGGGVTGGALKPNGSDFSIAYGADSRLTTTGNIVVYQVDAIQPTDRLDMGFGSATTTNHRNTNGITFFFRGNDCVGINNPDLNNQIASFATSSEVPVLTRSQSLNPQKSGEWANYAILVNKELKAARIYLNDQFRCEVALPGDNLSYFSLGGHPLNSASIQNLQIGTKNAWKAVQVFNDGTTNSSLIETVDYADTFTKDPAHTGNYSPGRLLDYQRAGLPQVSWSANNYAIEEGTNYNVGSTNYGKFDSYAGASTGFQQNGSSTHNYINYENQRDQFVVQLDAIQTNDRVGFGFGTGTSEVDMTTDGEFAVFFRSDTYARQNPRIAIYTNRSEKALQTLPTGLTYNQWNNYAVRVDGVNMELELFANEVSLGTFDLTQYGLTKLDIQNLGYDNYFEQGYDRSWTDNFQLGSVKTNGVTFGKSALLGDDLTSFISDGFRGTTAETWKINGQAGNLTFKKDSDGLFSGSRAGSATGVALLEAGSMYVTELPTLESLEYIEHLLVQADVNMADGGGIVFTNGDQNALQLSFADDQRLTLTVGDAQQTIDLGNDFTSDDWFNLALELDNEGNSLEAFVNEESVGSFALSQVVDPDGVGFFSTANGYLDNLMVGYQIGQLDTQSVPEPATWALLVLGILGILGARRRK